jgi:RNA 2',3'-cyclic 3'-phosphodiesterase
VRLFVAVFPPPPAVADLKYTVDRMYLGKASAAGRTVRLDPPELWHVTLAFLGEVPEERVPEVEGVLGAVADAWAHDHATRPPLALADGGRFGSGPSTVLWAGLHGDSASLRDLAGRVTTELSRAELMEPDSRPYRPHLTLARCGDRLSADEIRADLAELRAYAGPKWTVNELVLVSSVAGPPRRYDRLKKWDLSAR